MPIDPPSYQPYPKLSSKCQEYGANLVVVSKTRSEKEILGLYRLGQRFFGENRAHELIIKASLLPSDIEWHLIGHLQTNKVKSVLPYVSCIQSLDSRKLWQKIQDDAVETELTISCLLQIKVASEETKHGWDYADLIDALKTGPFRDFSNVIILGVMGMTSLTNDKEQIRNEMKKLRDYFADLKSFYFSDNPQFSILSMGMSGDYEIALEEGSNMIRIGSLLFD